MSAISFHLSINLGALYFQIIRKCVSDLISEINHSAYREEKQRGRLTDIQRFWYRNVLSLSLGVCGFSVTTSKEEVEVSENNGENERWK